MINQNFKNLFLGRSISNIGDSLYSVGLSWYIFALTNSGFWVGILNFALFLPNLFSFMLGDFIERHNKQKLLIYVEVIQGILLIPIILLVALKVSITIKAISICILAFMISTVGMNSYVIQDTIMPDLVPQNKLSKASMYMSFAYNTMDYIGNALGGVLLKAFSVLYILVIDIISFFISTLFFIRVKDKPGVEELEEQENSDKSSIFSGMQLIWNRKDLLVITVFGGLGNFFFGGLAVYDVLIGKELGGSGFYGIILAIESIGVAIGSTLVANLFLKLVNLGKLFSVSNIGMGIFLIISLMFKSNLLFLSLWMLAFIFQGLNRVVITPYLQVSIGSGQRAKFFSSFNTLTVATFPIGSLFFGALSTRIDWRIFVFGFALFMLLSSLLFILNRKIYEFKEPKKED
ncbi:MFS transporter [Pediococcus stilesii]|uniref:MFS transporter n=1 Tax=Pediococcus stilesii TaxID=331679 RepID=A0A5R9BWQ4_9LACO|nr:MFS transporter [Pediococcus stilesii]TLQ05134.1 MFS transporter [Pediococcus stilesii]